MDILPNHHDSLILCNKKRNDIGEKEELFDHHEKRIKFKTRRKHSFMKTIDDDDNDNNNNNNNNNNNADIGEKDELFDLPKKNKKLKTGRKHSSIKSINTTTTTSSPSSSLEINKLLESINNKKIKNNDTTEPQIDHSNIFY